MHDEQIAQRVEDIAGVQLALDADGEAFASELINDAQHAEDLSIMRAILDEIIGSDMPLVHWSDPNAGAVTQRAVARRQTG